MKRAELEKVFALQGQMRTLQAELDAAKQEAVDALCPYKPGVEVELNHRGLRRGRVKKAHYWSTWNGRAGAQVEIQLRKKDGSLGLTHTTRFVAIAGDETLPIVG